jgi:hypothetical protein
MQILMAAPTSDGGDMITSYQLQLKIDHEADTWVTVLGGPDYTSTRNLDLIYLVPIETAG